MQRIRIGLTGLAGVLVLVLFAAAMLGLRSADTDKAAANGTHIAGTAEATDAPKDPLAELGVIPGGTTADTTPAPAAPAAVQPAPPAALQPAPRIVPAPSPQAAARPAPTR